MFESPEYMDATNGAIDKTLDEHPEFFAGGINVGAYMATCRPAWDAIPP